MSYDLDLFKPQTGVDPITTIQRGALRRLSAQHETNHDLIQVLKKDNPDFHVQKTDVAIDVVEHVHGLKISLYHAGGQVSIPYWHTDAKVQRLVFWNLRRYLRLIQAETGYSIYDAQLEKVLDVETDMPALITSYKHTIASMQSFYGDF